MRLWPSAPNFRKIAVLRPRGPFEGVPQKAEEQDGWRRQSKHTGTHSQSCNHRHTHPIMDTHIHLQLTLGFTVHSASKSKQGRGVLRGHP